jgi:hypothetical protein
VKTKNHTRVFDWATDDTPEIKTAGLRIGVSDCNLEMKIKKAFELAKSSGRELDLTFSAGCRWQGTSPPPRLGSRRWVFRW